MPTADSPGSSGPTAKPADSTPVERLDRENLRALEGGGKEAVQQQHEAGKLTARERIDLLLDPGSFVESGRLVVRGRADSGTADREMPGDGVIAGQGRVDGRPVFVFAHDFTVFGGTSSGANARKICKLIDLALKVGAPVVGLHDTDGPRTEEGLESLGGCAEIFLRHVLASGVVPQISCILGPCRGAAAYSPAAADFVLMARRTGRLFLAEPDAARAAGGGETVTTEALGGPAVHATRSGLCHFVADDDPSCLAQVRALLAFLPSNNLEDPPLKATADAPARQVPEIEAMIAGPGKTYDVRDVARALLDDASLLELAAGYAPSVVVGFGRVGGRVLGIVANQPAVLAGVLDSDSSVKAARFVRFCDCFNIPILTLVDVPGFLPEADREHGRAIRDGAKLLFAFAEATVPKITVVLRKAYGSAYAAMASKHVRADVNLALPTAEIALTRPRGAVDAVHGAEIAPAPDPDRARAAGRRDESVGPYEAAELGFLDEIVYPKELRARIHASLEVLRNKRDGNPPKKHANLPL